MQLEGRVMGDWTAETVEIMRSELSGEGSRHSRLAEIPLAWDALGIGFGERRL